MGGKSSTLVHKITSPVTNYFYGDSTGDMNFDGEGGPVAKMKASPFVFKRRSSLYRDEDGFLAHEFYIEIPGSKVRKMKAGMMRISQNISPQGEVQLEIPRIHSDLPVVMYEKAETAS
ncbi:tumor suppressor candidate 2-like [Amphiura filiformis]|uniref:tumor suppressor candidate 2-like n=1 Tax=Amphiura filiformis TaxID=82378 RepID=UPI003B21EFDC